MNATPLASAPSTPPGRRTATPTSPPHAQVPISGLELRAAKKYLGSLPEADRAVVAALAVFGREVPALWIAAAAGPDLSDAIGPAVDRLRGSGLIVPASPGSPLLRLARPRGAPALEAALPAAERTRVHLAVARILSRRAGRRSAVELAEIARRLRHGPATRESIAAHRAAATACLSTGKLPLAAEAFAWLGGRARELPPQQRWRLRLDWARTLHGLGRTREATLRLREGWKDPSLRGDPVARATLARLLAALANAAGDHTDALRWIERAEPDALRRHARALAARLAAQRAAALWGLGRVDEATREVKAALRFAPEAAIEARRDLWSLAGTIAFWRKEFESAATADREALRLAERLGDKCVVARISANLAMTEGRLGRRGLARRLLERALRLFRAAGDEARVASILNTLGGLRYASGDLARSRILLEEALAQAEGVGDSRAANPIRLQLSAVRRCAGDFSGARSILSDMRQSAGAAGRRHEIAVADSNLAWIDAEMGKGRAARRRLGQARETFRALRDPEGLAFCARIEALLAEFDGDAGGIRRAVKEGRRLAGAAGLEILDRQLSLAGAIAQLRDGGDESAPLASIRAARQFFAGQGFFPGILEASRREAQVFLAAEDLPAARDRFRQVRRRALRAGFVMEAIRARTGEALATRSPKARTALLRKAREEASRLHGAKALREEIRRAGSGCGGAFSFPTRSAALKSRAPDGRRYPSQDPSAPMIPVPPRTREGRLPPGPFRYVQPALTPGLDDVEVFEGMVGRSPAMKTLFRGVEHLARYAGPILVEGETGTGKELLAAALHRRGPRSQGPYVPIACAALPEALVESEMFGVVAGAFTGAAGDRPGLWVQADGGDLLLDDLQDLPIHQQSKLLRVLETGEVRAVGATTARRIDVRVIATVNRPLELMVAEGSLRKALFYRLGAVVLRLPPLRERLSDLPALALHLLARSALLARRSPPRIEPGAFDDLALHSWPGNVRELEGFLERVRLRAERRPIEARHVAAELASQDESPSPSEAPSSPALLRDAINATRHRMIRDALRRHDGSIPRAAATLGISRQAIHRHLRASRRLSTRTG